MTTEPSVSRRSLLGVLASAIAGTSLGNLMPSRALAQEQPAKPKTNIADAAKQPRTPHSMPGKFPGRVIVARNEKAWSNDAPDIAVLDRMVEGALLSLTGASSVGAAWREFVTPEDIVGLKVNPVAGKLLSTSPEIVHVIITQLEKAGIPRRNIVIWDRRESSCTRPGSRPTPSRASASPERNGRTPRAPSATAQASSTAKRSSTGSGSTGPIAG